MASERPEAPLRQQAFARELRAFLDRFCREWDINGLEAAGLLFWAATLIVTTKEEDTNGN